MADQEFRLWLLDHEKRLTKLETQTSESRLRQVNISAWKLAMLSAGMTLLIWVLTLVSARLGWM